MVRKKELTLGLFFLDGLLHKDYFKSLNELCYNHYSRFIWFGEFVLL